ncbi:MAG: DegT/DnrJ/EryC1/StrS family aminotransferase, partial [Candidatus Omnitrophica bacterium]|nr:DegT/DnrJ/EryC1/StrS family aminotransferase [Candidatus Omnitrophota bacterium]
MDKIDKARKKILKGVKDYFSLQDKKEFIPGQTPIPYGGRVYDERELISLVDSSLDFWLTSGRYADKFENGLAKFLGVKYCLLTNSGSSA